MSVPKWILFFLTCFSAVLFSTGVAMAAPANQAVFVRVFLPAKWVAEGLGYAVGWDEKWQALLIGPPGGLPEAGYIPLQLIPLDVRPCVFTDFDGYANQKISSRSILFEGDYANVYNAGVAADYVNSFVLEPEKSFSFNEVAGERTKQRGFIDGYDILDELTVGGGVCRTSTVLFQAARDAGLTILERHPHYRPVHYAHTGTDASVSWGWMDLKFVNNLSNPLVIYCGLQEEENGSRLWAEFCEMMLWQKVDVAVLINASGADWQKDIDNIRLCALEKEGRVFISLEQIADLLHLSPEIKLVRGEISTAAVEINNQLISFTEGDMTAFIDDAEYYLNESPFCLINCNCNFWLSLDDWVNLAGGEIVRIDGTPSLIVLNLSGAALGGNNP